MSRSLWVEIYEEGTGRVWATVTIWENEEISSSFHVNGADHVQGFLVMCKVCFGDPDFKEETDYYELHHTMLEYNHINGGDGVDEW